MNDRRPGISEQDLGYVRRAIRLAMAGRGFVEPNPMVGCVLVKAGRVIGEGIHARYGGPHAEPAALASCVESPDGATAYVTLEPCCHLNKKTPPCAPRLIAAKVARVVVGCVDPNPEVDGKGIRMLRDAGVVVDLAPGGAEAEAKQLLSPFIKKTSHGQPYVTLKWAQSADGFVGGAGGGRARISGTAASRLVHRLRARCDAIVVGINTVLGDDPMLTARGVPDARPLRRVVLDRSLRLPASCALVRTAREQATQVICDQPTFDRSPRVNELTSLGIRVASWNDDGSARAMLDDPYMNSASTAHVLVEPGPTLARSMLPWADRLWVFRSTVRSGAGPSAPRAADVPGHYVVTGTQDIEGDELTEYLNTRSRVFFSATPSADLIASGFDAGPPS